MDIIGNLGTIGELEEIVKAEKGLFEAAREEARRADERSAVHFYRLGHALVRAKEVLGRGAGKPGTFRGWHVGLGINKDTASRAMRLYESASEDGGEIALAGMGWWKALIHYGIINDDRNSGRLPERPNHWDAPERRSASYEAEDIEEEHQAVGWSHQPTGMPPTFSDIPALGSLRELLVRHLVHLGASENIAERIARDHGAAIDATLSKFLKEKLTAFVEAESLPF